jgi:hypothetical protein
MQSCADRRFVAVAEPMRRPWWLGTCVRACAFATLVLGSTAATACSSHNPPTSSAGESLGTSTTLRMKPTGGLGHVDTNTVGCPFGDEWECVSKGTSFTTGDDATYLYSTAAGGRDGTSYSGAPAGTVTQVTTNVVAAAESGATGTATVRLYGGGKLIATGAAHPLTTAWTVYSDKFDVSVASADSLKTWVTFSSANLKYAEIWLAVTLAASPGDAGTDGTTPHSVTLSWAASSTPGVTYSVLRSTTNGSGYVSQISGLSALTWTDTSVKSGSTYYYVVDDSLGSSTSTFSNQATATIP